MPVARETAPPLVWETYDPSWLVALARAQAPGEEWLAQSLRACTRAAKRNERYLYFVDPSNPNAPGAQWQFKETFILERPEGEVAIDILKDGCVGGVEFLMPRGAWTLLVRSLAVAGGVLCLAIAVGLSLAATWEPRLVLSVAGTSGAVAAIAFSIASWGTRHGWVRLVLLGLALMGLLTAVISTGRLVVAPPSRPRLSAQR